MFLQFDNAPAPGVLCRPAGLGLFDSGDWGVGEWLAIAAGVYATFKLFGDVRGVRRSVQKRRRSSAAKAKRRRELKEELAGL